MPLLDICSGGHTLRLQHPRPWAFAMLSVAISIMLSSFQRVLGQLLDFVVRIISKCSTAAVVDGAAADNCWRQAREIETVGMYECNKDRHRHRHIAAEKRGRGRAGGPCLARRFSGKAEGAATPRYQGECSPRDHFRARSAQQTESLLAIAHLASCPDLAAAVRAGLHASVSA